MGNNSSLHRTLWRNVIMWICAMGSGWLITTLVIFAIGFINPKFTRIISHWVATIFSDKISGQIRIILHYTPDTIGYLLGGIIVGLLVPRWRWQWALLFGLIYAIVEFSIGYRFMFTTGHLMVPLKSFILFSIIPRIICICLAGLGGKISIILMKKMVQEKIIHCS